MRIVIALVPPLFPTLKSIAVLVATVLPDEVFWKVRVEVVNVPPMWVGEIIPLVNACACEVAPVIAPLASKPLALLNSVPEVGRVSVVAPVVVKVKVFVAGVAKGIIYLVDTGVR